MVGCTINILASKKCNLQLYTITKGEKIVEWRLFQLKNKKKADKLCDQWLSKPRYQYTVPFEQLRK